MSLHTILASIILLSACAPIVSVTPADSIVGSPGEDPTSAPQTTMRDADVQSVEVRTLPNSPAPLAAIVRGTLKESCASLGGWQVDYASGTFLITVFVQSPNDIGCIQALTPFEVVVPLSTGALSPGTYGVNANGVTTSFIWPIAGTAPAPVFTATPASQACIDSAAFIADVTIPDYSLLTPGAPFTKTWRIKNTGTCTWSSKYLVSYVSGTTMSQQPGYWIVPAGQAVFPGQSVDVGVGMTAPVAPGTYASYWALKNEDGAIVPIRGGTPANAFYVKIRVGGDDAGTGRITDESIAIELEQGSGSTCTAESTYFVTASISTDGPVNASYEIGSTAGQIPAGYFETADGTLRTPYVTGTLYFDRADTKKLALRFVGPYPYPADITVMLRVNGGEWLNTRIACS